MKTTIIVLLGLLTIASSQAHAANIECKGWLYHESGKGLDRATAIAPDSEVYLFDRGLPGFGGLIYTATPNKSGGMDLTISRESKKDDPAVLAEAENAESLKVPVAGDFKAAIVCEKI